MDPAFVPQSDIVTGLQRWLLWSGTLLAGGAVAWFATVLTAIMRRDLPSDASSWDFEGTRRVRLRQGSTLYRWFEPLVDELRGLRPLQWLADPRRVAVSLSRSASGVPWTAEEYVAVQAIGGLAAGLTAALVLRASLSIPQTIFFALLTSGAYVAWSLHALHRRGVARLSRLKLRLPFAMDLIALTMEAGGTFRGSLKAVVDNTRGEPLGDECATILGQISRGQTLRDALAQLQERLADDDIQEIVRTVKNAEEMGTPMSTTFLGLAHQMRLRRSQYAESLIGKSQTMLNFPGIIIMVACMLVVLVPFLLNIVR